MARVQARKELGITLGGIIGAAFIGSAIKEFAAKVAEGKYTVDVKFVEVKRRGKSKR